MAVQARIDRSAPLAIDDGKAQTTFVLTTLLSSLLLQRFGIPFGQQLVSVSVPIVGVVVVWYLWVGVLDLNRHRVAILFGVLAVALLSYNHSVNAPFPFVTKISQASLLYWLLLTSFAVLRFSQPMEEGAFFRAVIRVLGFIAICGLGAFAAQFAGLTLFSFSNFLPAQFSFEPFYNVVIPIGDTTWFKANGLFLVEPSTFSQFMALGLICEWVNERRPWIIGLFLFALFSAVSGTGWLAVGGFVAYIGLTSGSRGLATAIGLSCVCVFAFVATGFILPDVTGTLTGRVDEFGLQGTSGNGRFVTPFLVTSHIYDLAPQAFFTGAGPGSSDTFSVFPMPMG